MTERGIAQAKLANRAIGSYPFWRYYSSDLKRCETTASLILGHGNNESNTNTSEKKLVLDQRLRERAKGVREGRSKHLTYHEAFEIFCLDFGTTFFLLLVVPFVLVLICNNVVIFDDKGN